MIRGLMVGIVLLGALAASLARADLLYFKAGGQVQVPAVVEGDRIRLDTPGGPRIFERGDFLAIQAGDDPARDWPFRRNEAIRDGRIGSIFEASWWALENGLTEEAATLLRSGRGLAISDRHGPSLRALAALDALEAPCPDRPDLGSLLDRLRPGRFAQARSPHVVLLYQGEEAEARRRLDVLERVVTTFAVGFSAQGIALGPPPRKLVSVWFADREDYAAFLRRSDAAAFVETQGFYHPVLGVVFAYDTRSSDAHRARVRAIANRKNDGATRSEVDRLSVLLDLEWRATDLGIAAHETVHQMTVASALSRRADDLPAWLHEGLAAQFEVVRGGRWAGVGRINDLRMPDWRSIRPAPRLAPLLSAADFARGYRRDSYAEAWALVYFLRKTRPAEFLDYLERLRNPGQDANPAQDRSVQAFRASFGDDLPALEREWWRFMGGLLSPLESGRPKAAEAGSDRATTRG